MDREFWHQRWRTGQIGFHEGRPNAQLVRHLERLGAPEGRSVLVPLCGKAIDLAYLAGAGFDVEGVELDEGAARAFFVEQGLDASEEPSALSAERVRIHVGDLFEVPARGVYDAAYDRAALIAMRPSDRERYVARVRALLADGAPTLLVTLVHDAEPSGPPFSTPPEVVRALYGEDAPELLDDVDVSADFDPIRARGASSVREQVWLLRRAPR